MKSRYLPMTITLTEPVLLTNASGDPNSVDTLDRIQGSALRGAVAAWCSANEPTAIDELVLGDQVRYLDALPAVGTERALPGTKERDVAHTELVFEFPDAVVRVGGVGDRAGGAAEVIVGPA